MAKIRKILCAVDFSEHSPAVAEYTVTLAKALKIPVVCMYVAPSLTQYVGFHVPPSTIESFVGEIVSGADLAMESFLSEHFKDVEVQGRVVTGYAAEEILHLAEQEDVGLVIMGTHGRKGIDRILFGSVAEKVVKGAKCPVLTIRPTKK